MNQKGFAFIALIVAALILLGVGGYLFLHLQKTPELNVQQPSTEKKSEQKKYTKEPMMECVECVNGETFENKPCCTASFEKDCASIDGVVRWFDLHPILRGFLFGCFQKASDTGKECAKNSECISGVCDLESAINRCSLIRKDLTGEKSFGRDLFTASYACGTEKPGVCTETIENGVNPGGVTHIFRMDGKNLIEIVESGPIQ